MGMDMKSGNGVITMASPGMAAQQAAQGQPKALDWTMLHDGLCGILRARGGETASGWRKGRDESLVEANREYQHLPHKVGNGLPHHDEGAMICLMIHLMELLTRRESTGWSDSQMNATFNRSPRSSSVEVSRCFSWR